jgi:hypothetical protein
MNPRGFCNGRDLGRWKAALSSKRHSSGAAALFSTLFARRYELRGVLDGLAARLAAQGKDKVDRVLIKRGGKVSAAANRL